MASLFVLALLLVSPAKAGFGAKCIQSWTKSEKKIEGTYSDLSTCQQSSFGFKTANNILLGGTGSAEIVGIPSGSGGDGCDSGDKCMKQCQALCCITKGCIYSSVKRDVKTTDYVVYKEEEKKFYCRMYSSGKLKDSDSQSTCYPPSSTPTLNCEAIAFEGMGWNSSTYSYFVGLQTDNTCSAKRRLLQRTPVPAGGQLSGTINMGMVQSAIKKSIAKVFKPFKTLKKALKKDTTGKKQCSGLKGVVTKATSIIDSSC